MRVTRSIEDSLPGPGGAGARVVQDIGCPALAGIGLAGSFSPSRSSCFGTRRFFPHSEPDQAADRIVVHGGFHHGVLWFTGKSGSPLLNLYLLPIILSAFTLGRLVTLAQVAVIAVCHLALAAATPGLEVASLDYAARATGELAPFLLVAYLTTTLSADITEAREHIESLAQTDALTGLANRACSTSCGSASTPSANAIRAPMRCC